MFSTALIYNGINSSIDAARGKHDIYGSMTAGAITGAVFKSTGMCPWPILELYNLMVQPVPFSRCEASFGCRDICLWVGWDLEFVKD
jgi:hypothetical protein